MAHAVPVHNIPQFCFDDKNSSVMGVFCMKLVVIAFMREVKVSSGIDLFSPVRLEPAPHILEILSERYCTVSECLLKNLLYVRRLSFSMSTSYSIIVLSQVQREKIVKANSILLPTKTSSAVLPLQLRTNRGGIKETWHTRAQ
jgi:hypothetical protein